MLGCVQGTTKNGLNYYLGWSDDYLHAKPSHTPIFLAYLKPQVKSYNS